MKIIAEKYMDKKGKMKPGEKQTITCRKTGR